MGHPRKLRESLEFPSDGCGAGCQVCHSFFLSSLVISLLACAIFLTYATSPHFSCLFLSSSLPHFLPHFPHRLRHHANDVVLLLGGQAWEDRQRDEAEAAVEGDDVAVGAALGDASAIVVAGCKSSIEAHTPI